MLQVGRPASLTPSVNCSQRRVAASKANDFCRKLFACKFKLSFYFWVVGRMVRTKHYNFEKKIEIKAANTTPEKKKPRWRRGDFASKSNSLSFHLKYQIKFSQKQ
jgi:hypothetical protein